MKELELARREAALEEREHSTRLTEEDVNVNVVEQGGVNADVEYVQTKKNWPRCYPIVDHSYADIPSKLRKAIAWIGYIFFFLFAITLLFNFFTSIVIMFAPTGDAGINVPNRFRYLIIAGLIPVVGIPINFVLVYWTLYKAMRHATIPRFILSFIGNIVHILFCIFASVGWYEYGFGGLVTLISYFPSDTESYIGFIPNMIMMFLWYIQIIVYVGIFIISIFIFRNRRLKFKDMGTYAKDTVTSIPSAFSFGRGGGEQSNVQADPEEDIEGFYSDVDEDE